jgi:hypothetical protein
MTGQSLAQPVAATPSRADQAPLSQAEPGNRARRDLYRAASNVSAACTALLASSEDLCRAALKVFTSYGSRLSSDGWNFVGSGVLQSKPWWKWVVRTVLVLYLVVYVWGQLSTIPNLRLLSDQSPPMDELLTGTLALAVMAGSLWFAAGRIVAGLLGSPRFGVRLLARLTVCTWLLSVGFNLLINLGRFRLLDATCLLLLVAGSCAMFLPKPRRRTSVLAYALRLTRRHAMVYIPLGALLLLQLLRCLTQVPIAWDTLTYHATKSALWVQTGSHIALDMPGGWSVYRYYPSGGEALSAWAMLPFHSDLLYGVIDFVFWVGLGLALYEIARELGARGWGRLLAAVYLMFLPAIFREVGSGCVETSLDFALFGAAFMLVRYLKTGRGGYLVAAGMALGVALAIKVTAITYAAAWVLVVTGHILARRRPPGPGLRVLGVAAVCACLVYVPWAMHFALETGYPLGTTPVSVAGVPLGKMTEEMRFYVDRPYNAYQLDAELKALRTVFAPPEEISFHCSAASLLPMLLGAITLALPKARTVASWVLLPIVAVTVFNVYQPSFSVIRLCWASLCGRFVFPLVAVLVLYAVANVRPKPLAIALNVYLLVATGMHVDSHFFYGWADVDRTIVVMGALLTGAALRQIARRKPGALPPALAVLTAVTLVAAAYWKEADRLHFLDCSRYDGVPTYWLPAVEELREHHEPLRIAITAGMSKEACNQTFYHFLGARLQNRLNYIPVTEDGHIVPQAPEYVDTPLSFDAWRRRLIENKITHVIALEPASVELRWMTQAPEQFRRVVGDWSWGLFEFSPAPGRVAGVESSKL